MNNDILTPTHFRLPGAARTSIEIGLNVIVRVGRVCSETDRRAMIWCANYARLRLLNADQLSEILGLSRRDIRAALTNPEEDRTRFVAAVARVRAEFEASISVLYPTEVRKLCREAVAFTQRRPALVELVMKSRMGKTVGVEAEWHKLLDRALMVDAPTGDNERELHETLAVALGISCNTGKKQHQVKVQIASCFGPDMLSLLIVDEAHRLWPADPRGKCPKKIEYLRSIYRDGKGASVLLVATPQHSESLLLALDNNPRWSPDQWFGRRVPFFAGDTMVEADLRGIARHHAPDFSDEMITALVLQGTACEGFAGLVVNTIDLARSKAEVAGSPTVTMAHLRDAEKQMSRGSRIEQLARALAAKRPPKPLPVPVSRLNGHGHAAPAPVSTGTNTVRL